LTCIFSNPIKGIGRSTTVTGQVALACAGYLHRFAIFIAQDDALGAQEYCALSHVIQLRYSRIYQLALQSKIVRAFCHFVGLKMRNLRRCGVVMFARPAVVPALPAAVGARALSMKKTITFVTGNINKREEV
jgi:hypothetical protein